jgi:hypothetical protein
MHVPVSVHLVGAQHAIFDKHLKTHDRTFTRKYLGSEFFLSGVVR